MYEFTNSAETETIASGAQNKAFDYANFRMRIYEGVKAKFSEAIVEIINPNRPSMSKRPLDKAHLVSPELIKVISDEVNETLHTITFSDLEQTIISADEEHLLALAIQNIFANYTKHLISDMPFQFIDAVSEPNARHAATKDELEADQELRSQSIINAIYRAMIDVADKNQLENLAKELDTETCDNNGNPAPSSIPSKKRTTAFNSIRMRIKEAIEQLSPQQSPLLSLSVDLLYEHLAPKLPLRDLSSLRLACTSLGIFQPYLDSSYVSKCVDKSRLLAVKPIVKLRPGLLFVKGKMIDGVGYIHEKSPWQNAVWGKKWPIVWMMFLSISTDKYEVAYNQLLELEMPGLEHGPCYDATPIKENIESYRKKYQELDYLNQPTEENEDILVELWHKKGFRGHLIEALVNQYISKDSLFLTDVDSGTPELEASFKFYDWLYKQYLSWFPLLPHLSTEFGRMDVSSIDLIGTPENLEDRARIDLNAIDAWKEASPKILLKFKLLLNPALKEKLKQESTLTHSEMTIKPKF